jgi:hypothetical protein
VQAQGASQSAESWSPDGKAIAYTARSPGIRPKIMVAYPDSSREAQEFAGSKAPIGSSKILTRRALAGLLFQ